MLLNRGCHVARDRSRTTGGRGPSGKTRATRSNGHTPVTRQYFVSYINNRRETIDEARPALSLSSKEALGDEMSGNGSSRAQQQETRRAKQDKTRHYTTENQQWCTTRGLGSHRRTKRKEAGKEKVASIKATSEQNRKPFARKKTNTAGQETE
jgi:hypothetical protein